MNKILLAILLLGLIGCNVASGPRFKPVSVSDNESLLYVYKPYTQAGIAGASNPVLYIDGEKIGRIRINGYLPIKLSSGIHELAIKSSTLGVETGDLYAKREIKLKPGEIRYVRLYTTYDSPMSAGDVITYQLTLTLTDMPKNIGEIEVSKTKLVLD
jgi:hypothetical protein